MAATATATKATRTPSAFRPITRITVLVHADSAATVDATVATLSTLFESTYSDNAVRAVSRSRAPKAGTVKKATGPATLAVYIAPEGYEFAKSTASRGTLLDSDVADILLAWAAEHGIDTSDKRAAVNAVGKALAAKASAK